MTIEQIKALQNATTYEKLDLHIVVKDTEDLKLEVDFIQLQINADPCNVVITFNETITAKYTREGVPQESITTKPMIYQTNGNTVKVYYNDGITPVMEEGVHLRIRESLYWKQLAWENNMPVSFKDALTNTIFKYYGIEGGQSLKYVTSDVAPIV